MSIIIVKATSTDPNLPTLASSEPQSSQYKQALLAATGAATITDAIAQEDIDLIDGFILAMKTARVLGVETNLFAKLKYFMPLAGKSLSAALVPLVGAAGTNNNYVAGDYNETTGLQGGTSKSVTMPSPLSTYGSLIGKILRISGTPANTATHDVINPGWTASSVSFMLVRNSVSFGGFTNSGSGSISGTIAAAAGNYSDNVRPGNFSAYINRSLFGSNAGGGTVPLNALQLFRNTNRYGCFALTASMSEAEFIETDRLIAELMVAMGR